MPSPVGHKKVCVYCGKTSGRANATGLCSRACKKKHDKENPPPEPPPIVGPTLNHEYNVLYAQWQKEDACGTEVECEECGEDLTGKQVYDKGAWLCKKCSEVSHEDVSITVGAN